MKKPYLSRSERESIELNTTQGNLNMIRFRWMQFVKELLSVFK